jgi:hypothetical protein
VSVVRTEIFAKESINQLFAIMPLSMILHDRTEVEPCCFVASKLLSASILTTWDCLQKVDLVIRRVNSKRAIILYRI